MSDVGKVRHLILAVQLLTTLKPPSLSPRMANARVVPRGKWSVFQTSGCLEEGYWNYFASKGTRMAWLGKESPCHQRPLSCFYASNSPNHVRDSSDVEASPYLEQLDTGWWSLLLCHFGLLQCSSWVFYLPIYRISIARAVLDCPGTAGNCTGQTANKGDHEITHRVLVAQSTREMITWIS